MAAQAWSPGKRILEISDQITNADTECVGDNFQGVDGHIGLAAFDLPNVSAVESRAIGENVLSPPTLYTHGSDGRSNFFLNLLHSSQFGRTLDKTIQVIPCKDWAEPEVCSLTQG